MTNWPDVTGRAVALPVSPPRTGGDSEHSPPDCEPFAGTAKAYQPWATSTLQDLGRRVALWSWVTTTCATPQCLNPDHLKVHAPVRLAYPHGICVYCGRRASGRDHLLPRNWSGDTQRHFVVTVPACGTCNAVLQATITTSITERRALCHARLRKHYRSALRTVEFAESDLAEMGTRLREYVLEQLAKKAEVVRMLAWPDDPAYDLRALQHSGIEDPFVVGLIIADDPALRQHASAIA